MSSICGIVRLESKNNTEINEFQLDEMLQSSTYVCDDDTQISYNASRDLFIGNKLLYTTPDCFHHKIKYDVFNKDYYIAFDGKLNNRDELIQKIGLFIDGEFPDSYLIVHSYLKWGEEFVSKLEGEYAFSIWDDSNRKLIMARDRLGAKSLFYSIKNNILIWGSEIGQLLQHPILKNSINFNKSFLIHYLIEDPYVSFETPYKNITRLKPGHFLVSENGTTKTYKYYNFQPMKLNFKSENDYVEMFYNLFKNSVKNTLRSEGPIGVSLSGGLDSTSIVSLAHHIDPSIEFVAYSHTFKDYERGNEDSFIHSLLDKYSMDHTFIEADDSWLFKGNLYNTIGNLDEPSLHLNDAIMGKIPHILREKGIKTYVTGSYGDHVLEGNPRNLALLLKRLKLFSFIRESRGWIQNGTDLRTVYWDRSIKPLFGNKKLFIPPWINPEAIQKNYPQVYSEPNIMEIYWDRAGILKHFSKVMYGSGIETTSQILNSKGVEGRFPFLDYKLLEFMADLPNNMKLRPGVTKYILRQAMKGIMPEKIRNRKGKSDHQYLVSKGFKKEWEQINKYSNFNVLQELGFINNENNLKKQLEMFHSGLSVANSLEYEGVLRALSLEIWLNKKLDYLKGGD